MAINNISFLGNEVLFYDAVSRKILHYNYIKDSVEVQFLKFKKKSFYRNFYLVNNDKYLSSGLFDNNMYCLGDINKNTTKYYLEYPYLPNIIKSKQKYLTLARSYAYMGQMIEHPNLSRFVYFTTSAGYIQIIELKDTIINEITHLNISPPKGKVVFRVDANVWGNDRNSSACFLDGTTSDKYIYLLYSGKSYDEGGFEKGKYVVIFDWEGNKIKVLELDREAYGITLDKEDNELYAFTINTKTLKNEILRYQL